MKCREIMEALEGLSPKRCACDWDNVGLLVGRTEQEVHKVVVALDATKEVLSLADREKADMLITHHPMIFSPVKQVNDRGFTGEKILFLAEHGISYYAMHTNFDAVGGMAELAAGKDYLNLTETRPIEPGEVPETGMGRFGKLPEPMTAEQVAEYVKKCFALPFVMIYQREEDRGRSYHDIAVMPGSGKKDMAFVKEQGYSLYVTGDFGHHEGLDAMDMGLCVIDATHYGLEHIFISYIGRFLRETFGAGQLEVIEADMGCPVKIL